MKGTSYLSGEYKRAIAVNNEPTWDGYYESKRMHVNQGGRLGAIKPLARYADLLKLEIQ